MRTASFTESRAPAMAIGELARRTEVNIETIRYYERIALLPAPPRTDARRRIYGPDQLRALVFIRRARELGFAIDDIRALLALAEPGRVSCAEVERIASIHLSKVRSKLADLAKLESTLAETVGRCSREPNPICPVLDVLSASVVS